MSRSFLFTHLLSTTSTVSAQTLSFGFGDVERDVTLNALNTTTRVDAGAFSLEIAAPRGATGPQDTVALTQDLAPAEVSVASFLAQSLGRKS